MPNLPQPPATAQRSLQINIDSEDDARAAIQHLQAIKNRWDMLAESGLVDSVEFCIAEPLRRKVDMDLTGLVRWCRTYLRSVKPFEGNVHFPLPHYVPVPRAREVPVPIEVKPSATEQVESVVGNVDPATPPSLELPLPKQPPGKSKRPVTADTARA